MPFSREGTLWKGGWAIETYWRGWRNWLKFGRCFRKDFRLGPLRLLFGTSYHGGEACYRNRQWFGNGGSILLYTPRAIPKCPRKGCPCHTRRA